MSKVIAVVNQKGGVSKTTTVVNLGIGLANAGNRVLVIDADPQGSLSASLGYREPDKLKETLATVLGRVIRDEECDWKQLGIRHHEEGIDLHDFKNHPFQVNDDEDMADLVASIKDRGVLEPGIVRPMDSGGYEVIAGHRRKHAAGLAGLVSLPVFIKALSDEEAVDLMVYSNLKRSNIKPSEKAFAYRMQMEAVRSRN